MSLSHDNQLLASCSLDDIVKIIDVSNLGSRIKEQFDEEAYERDLVENPKIKKRKNKKGTVGADEEMKDEDDDEDDSNSDWESEDSDDSDDSDEDEKKKESKKDKKLNPKKNTIKMS